MDYSYDLSKNKVVTYVDYLDLKGFMGEAPKGKIDSIIRDNPDWEFIFFVKAELKDSSNVVKLLEYYDNKFPVVLDINGRFAESNNMKGIIVIGYICDKKNEIFGGGVIGSKMSVFDKEFQKIKKRI